MAKLICGGYSVTRQQVAQWRRSTLIKQDAHSGLGSSQGAARCVLQHRTGLLKGNAREESDDFADRHAVFEIFEEGGNGHTRSTEYPRSADALGVAFHRCTG